MATDREPLVGGVEPVGPGGRVGDGGVPGPGGRQGGGGQARQEGGEQGGQGHPVWGGTWCYTLKFGKVLLLEECSVRLVLRNF